MGGRNLECRIFTILEIGNTSSLVSSTKVTNDHPVVSELAGAASKCLRRALVLHRYGGRHARHFDSGIHAFVGAYRRTARASFATRRGARNRVFRLASTLSGPEQACCDWASSSSSTPWRDRSFPPRVDGPVSLYDDCRDGAAQLRLERRS
jgi:hypothetical protein